MSALSEVLASYVPKIVLRRLRSHPEPIAEAAFEHFSSAALYADISGFTALTERLESLPLAERGAGAEAVTQMINNYFEQLINLVLAHGGDIAKFTGDGLLALWPVFPGDGSASLSDAILSAGACGLAVQEALHDYHTSDGTRLSMRMGIGAGDVHVLYLGGVFQRWEILVAGEPIRQTSRAEKLARPGQVVLSPEAVARVPEKVRGIPVTTGADTLDAGRPPLSLREISGNPAVNAPLSHGDSVIPEGSLRPFIPQAIYKVLDSGLSAWLAELRRVTVLFINIPGLDHTTETGLPEAQEIVQELQKTIYQYEGSINKLNLDDKGTTLVAAYGLPPLAHENDAERGAQAALAVHDSFEKFGMRGAIGVGSGLAFCGVIGSHMRREYTMMGDPVNMAARLMQAAAAISEGPPILCDIHTYQSAQFQLAFESRSPIALKGKARPAPVFRPLGERAGRTVEAQAHGEWVRMLVGRREERFTLAERLQTLQRGGLGATFVIEGEAGIGKSRLIQDLVEKSERLGVVHLEGSGNSIDRETPYLAWRSVFEQIFRHAESHSDGSGKGDPLEGYRSLFATFGISDHFPLVNVVLNLGLEDNEITSQMVGLVRAQNTRRALTQVLSGFALQQPTVLIIEDAQWLDSASWALLADVFREVGQILLLLATRPIEDPLPAEFERILEEPETHHFVLNTLSREETADLVSTTLEVRDIPAAIIRLIHEKAEGHPFYSQELAYSLRDSGILQLQNGSARLAPGADVRTLSFPDTIQGVITSRIDRLDPTEKLTLKVASVLGRSFNYPALVDIHPIPTDKSIIRSDLEALDRLEMTSLEQTEPELSYIFKHIITQEVSYNLMSFAQRQQLHHAAGEWYERQYADDHSPFYARLAYHWSKAGAGEKAIAYYELAGEEALLGGAYSEAINLFREAIDWNRRLGRRSNSGQVRVAARMLIAEADFMEARWLRKLGEAYLGLGQLPESRDHLERALAILGRKEILSPLRMGVQTAGQIMLQMLIRAAPAGLFRVRQERQRGLVERARVFRNLGEISFFENDTLSVIHSVVTVLNLNERSGGSAEVAEVYANMGLICSFVPLHFLARFYLQKAVLTAEKADRLATRAYVSMVNGLYRIGIGDWARVEVVVREAIEIYRRIGDQRRLGETLSIVCMSEHLQGNFRASIAAYEELFTIGNETGNVQQETWGLDGQAINYLRLGDLERAGRMLDEARPLLDISQDVTESYTFRSIEAVLNLYLNRPLDALKCVQAALKMEVAASSLYSMLEGYAGIIEVLLSLWEQGYQPPFEYDFSSSAVGVCRDFAGYARRFPIGSPRARIWEGVLAWLSGNHKRAHRLWNRGLSEARSMNMPYEQALAHKWIGEHSASHSQAGQRHLQQARELFSALEAKADLSRLGGTRRAN